MRNYLKSSTHKAMVRLGRMQRNAHVSSMLFVAVFAVVGTTLLALGRAATPGPISLEAESGVQSSNACVVSDSTASGNGAVKSSSSSCVGVAPVSPPVTWCSDSNFPGNQGAPTSAPAGAVTVPAGNNGSLNLEAANTTYWFAPGTHTGVSVQPHANSTYMGAPGAILDGSGSLSVAFESNYQAPYYTGVVIEYLTIQNYRPDGSGGTVNQNGGPGWTVKYNSIKDNMPGAALMDGTNMVIQNNCLTKNGQYAINGYSYDSDNDASISSSLTGGPHDVTVTGNDMGFNNTCNWDSAPNFPIAISSACSGISRDCGCAGGAKFWQNDNVTISKNYVHDNYGDPGLWPDTGNNGFTIDGNYISNNWGQGIFYEVSYNAKITNNTFVRNALGEGPTNPSFPTGAIYLSEAGGDSRVPTEANINTITISGNVFTDNWDGVVLWENSDRFCGGNHVYGQPDGICTLVAPSTLPLNDTTTCVAKLESSSTNKSTNNPDYFDLCRWKTQNVQVNSNTFNFNAANIGSSCTTATVCGENAIFSNYGSGQSGVPYVGAVVPINMTFNQNNVFKNNTYTGAWRFYAWAQSNLANPVSKAQWMAPVTDKCSTSAEQSGGNCSSGFGQDAGSTFAP
ncbi:MAG TPA: right-handed parallel beta-helix repeat-containing protein [Patescibacteria group bacterium]|nr:right-handed parallel beta-helix repeat-containing protein [Patescibacteria group bacterium]